jgi:hypothetical protein
MSWAREGATAAREIGHLPYTSKLLGVKAVGYAANSCIALTVVGGRTCMLRRLSACFLFR